MAASRVISLSPGSFSSYSNSNLADIAARVVEEFRAENGYDSEFYEEHGLFAVLEGDEDLVAGDSGNAAGKDDGKDVKEIEFEFVPGGAEVSPISADEIFCNGEIKPTFNRNLSTGCVNFKQGNSGDERTAANLPPKVRLPLRRLFNDDLDPPPPRRSSSVGGEICGVPPETYCEWRPNAPAEKSSARTWKKSSSNGWSKRWRFRDLIHRSNSDGKDRFFSPSPSFKKGPEKSGKPAAAAAEASNSAHKPPSPPRSVKGNGYKRRSNSFLFMLQPD
ncbi:unnamed protein product [Cuscuta campestris]|uniref:Uncharacterized protein n=1 Tax=Cuscuta campestris TaxID=132261 RepID=A0A484N477_9ASTE|nr:unnamed protein product [Cuscuta campestris]